MARFLARRLLLLIPTLWGITLVTFVLIHLAPGLPTPGEAGDPGVSAAALAEFRQTLGLDQPISVQYAHWLERLAHLDFGNSSHDGRPVRTQIAEALPNTLLIGLLALWLMVAVAVPLGIHGAARPKSWVERGGKTTLFLLHAMPSFFVAILLIELLCGGTRWGVDWFPMQGLGWGTGVAGVAWHVILPVFCLAYGSWATLARQVRGSLREALGEDYVRTARAMGLPERRIVLHHGLRNALIPAVTVLSVSVPALLGGSVIVETIFGIPGLGRLGFLAVTHRDYNTLMGVATVGALCTLLANLIADVLYAVIDPRTTHGR